jgi:hypothetical protein
MRFGERRRAQSAAVAARYWRLHSSNRTISETSLIAFCGNGLPHSIDDNSSRILRRRRLLLIDYPGYGKNGGYATIASTRFDGRRAQGGRERLKLSEEQLHFAPSAIY